MVVELMVAALLAPPFWELRPPSAWTEAEIGQLLSNSPWAQRVEGPLTGGGVVVYLATARPAREAEEELLRRGGRAPSSEVVAADEYREYLRRNAGKVIVLAVRLPVMTAFLDEAELRRMEKDCVLRVGRRKYRMSGHFPPTFMDPCLRLVFPREVDPQDKTLRFELYLPGVPSPYRWAEFRLKEMGYGGKPAF
jgi:hypothetical protein